MAVGPGTLPTLHPVAGFRIGTTSAGVKKPGRKDLVLMEIAAGASTAGVFTLNQFCAAPVRICKQHLQQGMPSYLVTNTGNANAGTGKEGYQDALDVCQAVAEAAGVTSAQVLPFSTGVIGEKLPKERIISAIPAAFEALTDNGWLEAASGIMTTDTRPKAYSMQIEHQGQLITLTGISKGAGMIKPNMATMLAYIATDAKVEPALLQALLSRAADRSFNRITIDGDTSTNDSCMLIATGASGIEISETTAELLALFDAAVNKVLLELAQAIVRDGEGATKFVTISVEQAASSDEALKTAYAVAHSPLVKTALFASDPNWGRILAAVGYAGVDNLDVDALQIWLGEACIVENGGRAASYTEAAGQAVMSREEITIRILLNRGDQQETVWTTDLSKDYVAINADYRS
ncbi:bifunctional glutamate N-acetyltransferase/amino-acid acetyltransferase ArgJ [Amphritea sp. 2_MG-2023]|uniref:bifunctional glutamate N-acetyltransferase/amino-acid acetyltransferase ArgJ n=1 Tax=Amphritea TaxID=515417 RepID=UPI001C076D4A|nr:MULTISPECIES: bifunctional glutamate N-acetyltransferase/amino-acid acetyltransferase ArgJ [Amphritea]MBU2965181.1 bifunctional glutamate N-acetyltransferase/amino-acid acetyltransferase ArgJ [Amphritea atlantica]MDO6419750.1 bifunctional glutamate N-acetyltransferase/amino-acid acetyltransferase ArgJ [Amphritea sp. 2_MG-2023]